MQDAEAAGPQLLTVQAGRDREWSRGGRGGHGAGMRQINIRNLTLADLYAVPLTSHKLLCYE